MTFDDVFPRPAPPGPTLIAAIRDEQGASIVRPTLGLEAVHQETWSFDCDERGEIRSAGLPIDVALDVYIVLSGVSTAAPVDTTRIPRDANLQRTWQVRTRARVLGVTVDAAEIVVGGQLVQLGRRGALTPGFEGSMRDNSGSAVSDALGRYRIEGGATHGGWVVPEAAMGYAGEQDLVVYVDRGASLGG